MNQAQQHPQLPAPLQRSRLIILLMFYGLFGFFFVNALLIYQQLNLASLVVWFIQILPLLIFIPGLHKIRLRTYAWLSFVVLLYFMHGVLKSFQTGTLWLGLTEVTLCVVLFVFLMLFIRAYKQHYQVNI